MIISVIIGLMAHSFFELKWLTYLYNLPLLVLAFMYFGLPLIFDRSKCVAVIKIIGVGLTFSMTLIGIFFRLNQIVWSNPILLLGWFFLLILLTPHFYIKYISNKNGDASLGLMMRSIFYGVISCGLYFSDWWQQSF